jgi:hypothetical protein
MIRYMLGIISIGAALPAWGLTYYLSQDLGVHGLFHVCRYSNGKLYSFNATDLCPLQVEDDGQPAVGAYQPPKQTGFKTGEYMDGMTKVCVYDVLGHTEAIRIGSAELCPLSHNF